MAEYSWRELIVWPGDYAGVDIDAHADESLGTLGDALEEHADVFGVVDGIGVGYGVLLAAPGEVPQSYTPAYENDYIDWRGFEKELLFAQDDLAEDLQ